MTLGSTRGHHCQGLRREAQEIHPWIATQWFPTWGFLDLSALAPQATCPSVLSGRFRPLELLPKTLSLAMCQWAQALGPSGDWG